MLLGVVTHKGHEHCRERFQKSIQGFKKVIIAALDEDTEKAYSDYETIRAESHHEARKALAEKAKDSLLLVEGDIIMPENVRLLEESPADITGAPYLDFLTIGNLTRIAPVVFAYGENDIYPATIEHVLPHERVQAAAVGFGCCLLKGKALTLPMTNPIELGKEAQQQNMVIAADCRVKCVHATPQRDLDWPAGIVSNSFTINMDEYGQ